MKEIIQGKAMTILVKDLLTIVDKIQELCENDQDFERKIQ